MGYNQESMHQMIRTFKEGLTQLENYLLSKDAEYQNRFANLEYHLTKNKETKRKILELLQEDLND